MTKSALLAIAAIILMAVSCKKEKTAVNNGTQTTNQGNTGTTGPIANADFEADVATKTPTGWSVTADNGNADASYTQSGGYTGKYALSQYKATAYKVYTYQSITGLDNGYYTLTAWTQNGGGQNFCYLSAKDYGGSERMTSLPVGNSWVKVVVRGIQVTNGKITIGLNSDANAGNWVKLDDVQLVKDDNPYNFLKGGDVSELSYVESKGGKFFENGVQKDCFQILKDMGVNIVRLRLYNDPGNPSYTPSSRLPQGFQNTTDILKLAKRAKAAGMQILLTFHYSDYWTNSGTQNKPHDWANLSYADLKTAVYNFTLNFMNQMKAQGTTPEFVSLGNETASGILFPDGDYNHFNQMAELFNQGYDAVKSVSSSTQVIIHLNDAGNSGLYDWFFPALISAGGKFDLIGASYYPFWTGKTVTQIQQWAVTESTKYNKKIIIMETGYDWNPTLPDGSGGQLADNGPYSAIYPATAEGQKDFLYECFNGLKNVDNGSVIGDIYWDPVMLPAPGVGWELGAKDVVANSTLFDFNGNALVGFKAFQYDN